MDSVVKQYMAEIGRRGGTKSRRSLDSETAQNMVRIREARRAFRHFHARCFSSCDPGYRITLEDIPWVAEQLMKFGGRKGWELGARLCR